jgi:hypothetical protein
MLTTLVWVDRKHMAQIGTVRFAYYLFGCFFKYLGSGVFEELFIQSLYMLQHIFVFQKLVVGINLCSPALKKLFIFLV